MELDWNKEAVYELDWRNHNRPVRLPNGEHRRSRWRREFEHSAANLTALHTVRQSFRSDTHQSDPTGQANFAFGAFAQHGLAPVEPPDELPGIRLALNPEAKTLRIFDPFETMPDFEQVRVSFVALYQRHLRAEPEEVIRLSDAELERWQAWLERADGVVRLPVEVSFEFLPSNPDAVLSTESVRKTDTFSLQDKAALHDELERQELAEYLADKAAKQKPVEPEPPAVEKQPAPKPARKPRPKTIGELGVKPPSEKRSNS